MSRAIDLVHQWTCEKLTPEEEAELGALLSAGDEEAQEALELLQVEAMLRGELVDLDVTESVLSIIQRDAANGTAERVLVKIAKRGGQARPVGKPRRIRRTHLAARLIAAAAVLVVVGGISWTLFRPGPPLDQLTSDVAVKIETDEGFVEYDGRGGLPLGQRIATGESPSTRVRLQDGSDLEMGRHTVFAVEREEATVRVELTEGQVVAQVAKQGPGSPFTVRTPNFTVEVVGTRFSVSHEAGLSTVTVEEGAVDVVFPRSDRRERLTAGEDLTASESGVLADPAEEYWREDFEQGDLADWWMDGKWVEVSAAPAGNGSTGCLRAAEERDVYYKRDILVARMADKPHGLFTCDDSLVVRFRYYATPSCHWIGIWMQAASGGKYYVSVPATLGSWQTAEVRLQEARSSSGDPKKPMPPGEMFQVMAFQAERTQADSAFFIDDLSINRPSPETGQ